MASKLGNVAKLGMATYVNRLERVFLAHLPHENRLLRSRICFGAQQSMLWCAAKCPVVRSGETADRDKMTRF